MVNVWHRLWLVICCLIVSFSSWGITTSIRGGEFSWNIVNDRSAVLEFKLDEGWHIFWQHPGTVGVPFSVMAVVDGNDYPAVMSWPVPGSFAFGPLEIWGYEGHVRFPVTLPKEVSFNRVDHFLIKGQVCKDICIPVEVNIPKPAYYTDISYDFELFLQRTAIPQPFDGFIVQSEYLPHNTNTDLAYLNVHVDYPDGEFTDPRIFESSRKDLGYRLIETNLSGDKKQVQFTLEISGMKYMDSPLESKELQFLITDGDRGFEVKSLPIKARPPKEEPAAEEPQATAPLEVIEPPSEEIQKTTIIEEEPPYNTVFDVTLIWQAILIGLIFNVMPCVFPVLGIKLSSILNVIGEKRFEIRLRFILTAIGIILAFALLAGALILVKSLGASVGWGMQFQQPMFITALVIIMVIFAASLFGFWSLRQPSMSGHTAPPSLLGEIGSGMLATILATPCTVPLMAPVAAFAFAATHLELLLIFIFMGVGMALPWLLVAFFPSMVNLLPKPGRWMVYFKYFLGLLLLGTIIWLLWILYHQIAFFPAGVIAIASLLILLVLAFGQNIVSGLKWAMVFGLSLLMMNMSLLAYNQSLRDSVDSSEIVQKGGLTGESYSKAKFEAYQQQGRSVLVIGTAEWCVTCKLNEKRVFSDQRVINTIKQNDFKILIADLTLSNEEGEAWQQGLDRYGLPLTVFYRNEKEIIILPTILNVNDILRLKPE